MNRHLMHWQAGGQVTRGRDGPLCRLPALRASLAWMLLLSIHETHVEESDAFASGTPEVLFDPVLL